MTDRPHDVVLSWGAGEEDATVELYLNMEFIGEVYYLDRQEPVLRLTADALNRDIPVSWLQRSLERAGQLIASHLDGSFLDRLPEVDG